MTLGCYKYNPSYSVAADESSFCPPAAELVVLAIAESINQDGQVLVHQVVLSMMAGPKPTLQLLRFRVSVIVVVYLSHLVWSGLVFHYSIRVFACACVLVSLFVLG